MSESKENTIHKTKSYVKKYISQKNIKNKYTADAEELVEKMILHECYDNPNYKWSLNNFELGHRIGRGMLGRVFVAKEKQTGLIVALKTMSKYEIHKKNVKDHVLKEIEIHSHLSHPNILQMYAWFHDDYRIYLALEYAVHGELYKHLKANPNGRFDEVSSAKYVYQTADALDYCHKRSVIHRDIKPENLLLDTGGNLKVADFGLSVQTSTSTLRTRCGTPDYMAPEIVEGSYYGEMVDNWCVGILCYELLVGIPPFQSSTSHETYAKIRSVKCQYPDFMPKGGVDLIKKLLVKNIQKRLTLEEVMQHPWIQANYKPKAGDK